VHDVGSDSDVWTFVTPGGRQDFRVSGGFLANDGHAVHLAARAGYGIALLTLLEVLAETFRKGSVPPRARARRDARKAPLIRHRGEAGG
jgi:hypothetical protein